MNYTSYNKDAMYINGYREHYYKGDHVINTHS